MTMTFFNPKFKKKKSILSTEKIDYATFHQGIFHNNNLLWYQSFYNYNQFGIRKAVFMKPMRCKPLLFRFK